MSSTQLHFGFWNIRGLNDPIKQKEVKSFVKNNKLSLMGLIEHKIKEPKSSRVFGLLFPQWSSIFNFDYAQLAGFV